jgi:hypothetical protein
VIYLFSPQNWICAMAHPGSNCSLAYFTSVICKCYQLQDVLCMSAIQA